MFEFSIVQNRFRVFLVIIITVCFLSPKYMRGVAVAITQKDKFAVIGTNECNYTKRGFAGLFASGVCVSVRVNGCV